MSANAHEQGRKYSTKKSRTRAEPIRPHARRLGRLGGFLQVSPHFAPPLCARGPGAANCAAPTRAAPPQAREVRGLDGEQYLLGAASMSARVVGLRLQAFLRRRVAGEVLDQSDRHRRARRSGPAPRSAPTCRGRPNVDDRERLVTATERHAAPIDGGPGVVFAKPATSVSSLAARRTAPANAAAGPSGDDHMIAAAKALAYRGDTATVREVSCWRASRLDGSPREVE